MLKDELNNFSLNLFLSSLLNNDLKKLLELLMEKNVNKITIN